jgi:hypothetical protein
VPGDPREGEQLSAPQRIAVIGGSGSGKSTLAAVIAARLDLSCLATDQVFWNGDWRAVPHAETRAWLADAVSAPAWVTDGNFDGDRDLLWARAELIVWLDLPLARVLAQAVRRNLGWWLSGARVWGGQRMTLAKAWSGWRHAARSHGLKRRTFPGWLAELEGVEVVRLTSRAEVRRWLAGLSSR